ncbi:hypothetical protein [Marinobacter zhejiangensis]|uniref:Uncharacterized protein n=1 Tax=Marinobacter zhejiangensis TaxID=488535 RepID=A0A1I4QDT4_9GAMM|nr:hypothetical protein [Marinobacter zhejiangensis]SFM37820.1 hypothetical protein SAMN04487963_2316 [Marinobacter zhejiangensis]
MPTDTAPSPGTAPAAKLKKAGCGFRFCDDELQEGIDFSNANQLLPVDPDEASEDLEEASSAKDASLACDKDRQPDNHG